MKKKNILLTLFLFVSVLMLNTVKSYANEFGFAVEPQIPENQIDKSKTYYDLQLDPGQAQQLSVHLVNDTDNPVKVEATIKSATTNSNVVVEYGPNKLKADKSLKYNLADYAKMPNTIDIPAKSTLDVPIDVTMPSENFDGVMAGGITFKEIKKDNKTADSSNDKGLAIQNEYSYVVALLLRENTNEVAPNLKLHTVKASQVNARNVILANVQNDQATYINQVAIDAQITEKGKSKVLYKKSAENLQIAPNTNFDFPVSLNGKSLKAGTYHLKMIVNGNQLAEGQFVRTGEDKKEIHYSNQWILEKDFTIKAETAKKLNAKDVSIKKDYTWLYILIGILLLLLVIILIWVIRRRKKKNDEEAEKVE
ncbi:DUF916 and DUF3324 domain-containing protein [Enterococcus sp. AZ103]|uniref:DUF916 and DUF3324 domain-containing protein n=1 Tax=Enterococcus sp. AZ103 TaxID=2774628 RepID=UPI003F20725F